MRLDKYLADMKCGTRSEVKKLIKAKRVKVNGETMKDASYDVRESDTVTLDSEEISYVEKEYYLLYKPAGTVCALEDRKYPVVMELIDSRRKDLFPVGRLDLDTEGVLLITNDGKLAHSLLSPKHHVEKTYYAETENDLPEDAEKLLETPMDLGDFITLPAKAKVLSSRSAELTVHEGKYHQVKRMFEKIGAPVSYLKRISFGGLDLTGLDKGDFRSLSEEEIEDLKRQTEDPA